MLEEYKQRVLLDYQKKKQENILSPNLINPSPGRLRDECLIVYHERPNPKDDEILRLFFSSRNNDGDYSKSIENFNIDEFRPLVKLLNGKIERPGDRNIHLLAWLLDFEPRPYRFGQPYGSPVPSDIINEPNPDVPKGPLPDPPNPPDNWRKRFRNSIIAAVLILFTCGWVYVVSTITPKCMYWASDHYEPISCDENINAPTIPFDERVANLRRITRPDTLTTNALGKVWYAKVKIDSVQFYTDSGEYPLDRRKRLLPITLYMLKKYVFDKRISKQK